MLAVFCLRVALGMLTSLLLLDPNVMHPRFFRTHFLTVLGLSALALFTSWTTSTEEQLLQRGLDTFMISRRAGLTIGVVAALIGAIVWNYERSVAGWASLIACVFALAAALAVTDGQEERLQLTSFGTSPLPFAAMILNDLSSAAVLGFAITSMLVGHSYLIWPGLSIKPLMWQTASLGIALTLRSMIAGVALWFWSAGHDITNLNDESVLWLPVRWLIGLMGPAVFGFMAYRTARIKSTQSATGILYVVVILVFLGELTSLLLIRNTGLLL
jgi:hypothetical protein